MLTFERKTFSSTHSTLYLKTPGEAQIKPKGRKKQIRRIRAETMKLRTTTRIGKKTAQIWFFGKSYVMGKL